MLEGEYAEIICDLHHVNQYSIKLAKKCISNLYAISDSTIATGKPDGEYKFGGKIVVKKNGTIKIKNSNILAGSVVNMHQTFKNLININFSLNEAVALTSYNASQYINEYNIGKISTLGSISPHFVLILLLLFELNGFRWLRMPDTMLGISFIIKLPCHKRKGSANEVYIL